MKITRPEKERVYVINHSDVPKGLSDSALGMWFRIFTGTCNEVEEESEAYKELVMTGHILGNELIKGDQVSKVKGNTLTEKQKELARMIGMGQMKAVYSCTDIIKTMNTAQWDLLKSWLIYKKKIGNTYKDVSGVAKEIKAGNVIDIANAMEHAKKNGYKGFNVKTTPDQRQKQRLSISE